MIQLIFFGFCAFVIYQTFEYFKFRQLNKKQQEVVKGNKNEEGT